MESEIKPQGPPCWARECGCCLQGDPFLKPLLQNGYLCSLSFCPCPGPGPRCLSILEGRVEQQGLSFRLWVSNAACHTQGTWPAPGTGTGAMLHWHRLDPTPWGKTGW